jgi:CIC family chloride channel protein
MLEPSPQPNVTAPDHLFPYPTRFWMMVVLSGLAAGICGGLLMRLLRVIEHRAYVSGGGDFLDQVIAVAPERRVAMLLGAGVIAGVAGYVLPRLLREKAVGLNSAVWFRSGRLPLLPTLLHAVESIVIVGMGVSLGREGALKDTAGAIASKLSDWFSLPDEQRRLLVACAAGAGMAAAYNIPLGGALFAVEVLLGSLAVAWVLPALAASMLATAASWLLLPNQPAYTVPAYVLHPADLLWVLLAAPLFGLAAVLWVRALAWAQTRKPQDWHALAAPLVVFPLVGVAAIWFPDLLGNGKGLVQRAFVDALDLKLLGSLLVLRLLATAGCLATGAPGGVFTPTMAFGALLGGGLGRIWAVLVPVSAAAPDVGAFAVIGSAAVLAAATQGPISSIVMMIELTHHVDAIMVPILLATVIAALTASRMERRSVYSATVKIPAKIPTETPAAINPAGAVSTAPARSDLTPR